MFVWGVEGSELLQFSIKGMDAEEIEPEAPQSESI